MTSDEEMPLESQRKHLRDSLNGWFFPHQMIDGTNNQMGHVLPNITDETAITLKTGAFPKQNRKDKQTKKAVVYLLSELWPFIFLEYFLRQRSYNVNRLGFCLLASPIDFSTSVTTVWHQSQIRWRNDPFFFFRQLGFCMSAFKDTKSTVVSRAAALSLLNWVRGVSLNYDRTVETRQGWWAINQWQW